MLCNAAIAAESMATPSDANIVQLVNSDALIQPRYLEPPPAFGGDFDRQI